MNSCINSQQSLYTLFGEACRPLMGDKKFLTNEEFKSKQGKFSILSGALHRIERDLNELKKIKEK